MAVSDQLDPTGPTALEALRPLASSEVTITGGIIHREVYTQQGLLTALVNEPAGPSALPAAIVMCGGALGAFSVLATGSTTRWANGGRHAGSQRCG